MEPEARYTFVGSVVLILLVLLAGALVWLRSTGEGADALPYKIYFERQSLEGLEPRSEVLMRGMHVGSVKAYRFSADRPGVIEVVITVQPSTPVRQSTRATVERNLITSIANVQLSNATEDSPRLTQTPPGEPYPVIPEGESSMQQVSQTLGQLAARADETMQRINETLSPENRAALGETLEHLRRASQHAESTLARVDTVLGALGGTADEVRALAASVAADARTLTARYDRLGADASVSVQELGEAARRMTAEVDRLSQRADALLASGNDELRSTASAVRSAADALGAAADSVGSAASRVRDRGVVFGPPESGLGPGEGTP